MQWRVFLRLSACERVDFSVVLLEMVMHLPYIGVSVGSISAILSGPAEPVPCFQMVERKKIAGGGGKVSPSSLFIVALFFFLSTI